MKKIKKKSMFNEIFLICINLSPLARVCSINYHNGTSDTTRLFTCIFNNTRNSLKFIIKLFTCMHA